MASLDWRVLATDTELVINKVLSPNITRNASLLPGLVQVRHLDWTVPPDQWSWHDSHYITMQPSLPAPSQQSSYDRHNHISPPFDLIVTADTLYLPAVLIPLLRSLYALCTYSSAPYPPVLVALERRDSAFIDQALATARELFGFITRQISHRRLVQAANKSGVTWDKKNWDGIEIWKFSLKSTTNESLASENV